MTTELRSAIAAETAFLPGSEDVAAIDASSEPIELTDLIAQAESVCKRWIIELPYLGEILETLAKHAELSVFHTNNVPGSLFVTTEALAPNSETTVLVSNGVIGSPVEPDETEEVAKDIAGKRVTKVLKTAEERFVLGVVLVPETTDSQGDIYSHDEVRKAAHGFMENARALGKQHSEIVTGKLKILENYVAPVDFEADGETVAKGTWLMAIRVVDDDLWSGIKKGDFTGFSIGGQAFRKPADP